MSTSSDEPSDARFPPAECSRRRRDIIRLMIWCLICVSVPLVVLRNPPRGTIDGGDGDQGNVGPDMLDVSKTISELRAAQPDYVGIGNSMMFTRLGRKPDEMSALTGRKFFFIYKGGSDVPIWYLTLKNVVAASGVRPKAIVLFVRDNELTTPYFARSEAAATYMRGLRGKSEPELDKFMGRTRSDGAGAVVGVDDWIRDQFYFPAWKEHLSRRTMDLAMDVGGIGATKKAQRFALSARFSLEHLRADVPADMPLTDDLSLMTNSYEQGAEVSLLPQMIRLAENCGARLLVFRVKKRPDGKTHLPDEPEAMRDYSAFLGKWLKERGGIFFDETYDTSIHLTDYLDGDHIRPERLDWYREYFWQRMKGVFP